ncbi:heterokaryon incompatibility protein-domain-containing protein [Cladorrhinum sp. PSN332]|nr:heterokaryon incompatibility protein-domain-containing protein [Cladorrhinum sp. PSN332]
MVMIQMPNEPVYEYSPLPANHIRLLNLHSGSPESPLSGELVTVPLFPSSVPFSAISYVWGHSLPSNSSNHFLSTPTGVIRLSPSLSSFLLRLRDSADQSRLLWADAICINQANLYEKESQVALMADIYRSAAQVLADLGEEAEDSALALEAIDKYWRAGLKRGIAGAAFGRQLTSEETARFLDLPLSTDDEVKDGEEDAVKDPPVEVREAVIRFFERQWFTRIWVVQEFVLAQHVELYCGTKKVQWQQLFAAGMLFEGMPMLWHESVSTTLGEIEGVMTYLCMAYIKRIRELNSTEEGKEFVRHLGSLSDGRLMRFYVNPGLADLLHYLRTSRATLGRDRYFALLGLATDLEEEDRAQLRPDYISSDDQIVRRFARHLIRKVSKDMAAEIFMRAGLWRATNPELPSWFEDCTHFRGTAIVDFTVQECTHKAAGDTEFQIGSDPEFPDVIQLKGYRVDSLQGVCPAYGPSENARTPTEKATEGVFDYIRQGAVTLLKFSTNEDDPARPGPYLTGEELADAAALTLCAYRGIERLSRDTLCRGFFFMCMAVIGLGTPWANHHGVFHHRWSSVAQPQILNDIDYYATELGTISNMGVIPAVSDKGYFVSGPPGTAIDDQIWIIQGCRLPILLRRSDEIEYGGQYRLVGSCYVHGVMNGEALEYPDFAWSEISVC